MMQLTKKYPEINILLFNCPSNNILQLLEHIFIGFGGRMCTCRQGYVGNGIGASGCVQQGPTTGACASNPCRNGGLCQVILHHYYDPFLSI